MTKARVAVVAAMEREVRPLISDWPSVVREHQGRRFEFYENGDAVLVCGGIGAEAARSAAEAVVSIYAPQLVMSVGFAGALLAEEKRLSPNGEMGNGLLADKSVRSTFPVGAVLRLSRVIDIRDGSSAVSEGSDGTLISVSAVIGPEQKKKLAKAYGALAVDMEAASVARVAELRGLRFSAIKVISDEVDFEIPGGNRFIGADGGFRPISFVAFAALRPWLWNRVFRLAQNSRRAAEALCNELRGTLTNVVKTEADAHLSNEVTSGQSDEWSAKGLTTEVTGDHRAAQPPIKASFQL